MTSPGNADFFDRLINDPLDESLQEEFCSMLESIATHGEPLYSVEELFNLSTLENLQETARNLELEGYEQLSKSELAALLAKDFTKSNEIISEFVMRAPEESYDTFMMLLEHGGSYTIPYADVMKSTIPLIPMPPFIYLFAHNNEFTILIPNDIAELAASVDLQHDEDSREEIWLVNHFIHTYTELRGIIKVRELYELYHERDPQGLAYEDFLQEALITLQTGEAEFTLWSSLDSEYPICDEDGEDDLASDLYFIHWMLTNDFAQDSQDEFSDDPDLSEVDTVDFIDSFRVEILEQHKEITPKIIPSTEIESYQLLADMLKKTAVVTLVDYLFNHVPEDIENDEEQECFVTELVEDLFKSAQLPHETDQLVDLLEMEGVELDQAEKEKVTKMIEEVVDQLPSWQLNGHSPAEICERA